MEEQGSASFIKGALLASCFFVLVIYFHYYSAVPVKYFFASRDEIISALTSGPAPEDIPPYVHQQILGILANETKQATHPFPESTDPAFWTAFELNKKAEIIAADEAQKAVNMRLFYSDVPRDDLLVQLGRKEATLEQRMKRTSSAVDRNVEFRKQLLTLANEFAQARRPK